MGISGSEKSTIRKSLSDNDRQSWLEILNGLTIKKFKKSNCLIVCSALKQKYRKILSQNIETQTKWRLIYKLMKL